RMTVDTWQFLRQLVVTRDFFHELVVFAVVLKRRLADQPATFDAEMILRDRKRIFSTNLFDGDTADRFAVGNDVMRITCGAQQIAIEAAALAHAVQTRAAIA